MSGWNQVMNELIGARLAVYDAVISRGEIAVETLAGLCGGIKGTDIAEALQWLERAQLVRQPAVGKWRARSTAHAEMQWHAAGAPVAENFMRGSGAGGTGVRPSGAGAVSRAPEFQARAAVQGVMF